MNIDLIELPIYRVCFPDHAWPGDHQAILEKTIPLIEQASAILPMTHSEFDIEIYGFGLCKALSRAWNQIGRNTGSTSIWTLALATNQRSISRALDDCSWLHHWVKQRHGRMPTSHEIQIIRQRWLADILRIHKDALK